ncbi:transglutaminase TgpA family protein [Alkalihalobacterium alkalinitrilicum]|uniref:transglutaminase TgpA family protein n=1 Tax=Alkalihalobacterium alkalinitrilicum TaxID=427920 RepID=UPI00099531C0|nr:transglutaminaseTgpA domain-containing protein [Alkalihalobacterium alkalinitrilicum]
MKTHKGRHFFLYMLSYVLLLEWLLPLPYITDTGFISFFIGVTLLFFLLTFLQVNVWISFPLKLGIILYGLHLMFLEGSFLSFRWFELLLSDFGHNLSMMFSGNWTGLTDMFRSLLFFILLAVMSYLLYFWTVYAKRILFFLLFTIIYITVIDTFTPYDASYSIVRIFMVGFLLLGLMTLYRTIEREKVNTYSSVLPVRLIASLCVVLLLASSFGYAAPKYEPQWEDPVPYMKAAIGMNTGQGRGVLHQRIGYGDNDGRLGGGFEDDDTPVFQVVTPQGQYWRGESKDFYTGKGWEVTTPEEQLERSYPLFGYEVDVNRVNASVAFEPYQNFQHIFYAGEPLDVSVGSIIDVSVYFDAHTGRGNTYYGNDPIHLESYNLTFLEPKFSVSKLREVTGGDPERIESIYLQLPDTLPDRVGELAEEITGNFSNRYDQVKAIERYYRMAGFRYETKNVAVPGPDEDYVDQFLFETKVGYCDNYSTSMVVMLRTLDIPARWVKGFTQGERIQDLGDGNRQYQVTNANAHSWVEVYFPGHGWVPFEPTQGFNNASNFVFETPELEAQWEREMENPTIEPEVEETMAEVQEDENAAGGGNRNGIFFDYTFWFVVFGTLIIVAMVSFILRKKILVRYLLFRYGKQNNERSFELAFHSLIWLLGYKGIVKRRSETLREFAARIDSFYSMNDMVEITLNYEKVSYGNKLSKEVWNHNRELWENLIKKIGS